MRFETNLHFGMSLADGQVDGQHYFDFFKVPLCGFNNFNIDLFRL